MLNEKFIKNRNENENKSRLKYYEPVSKYIYIFKNNCEENTVN